ncbi:MAG TPA: lanthionine synthetase LanC family protein, partial [Pseudonocardiaceae bacterium]
ELLTGDVPLFATAAGHGVLTGPGGLAVGEPRDLVAAALDRWRGLGDAVEGQVIETAVVSAYRDEDGVDPAEPLLPGPVSTADLDARRRRLAADLVREAVDHAVRGDDGTVTWTAPTLLPTGVVVRPLGADVYSGLPGVALVLAGYRAEVAAGRADEVPGSAELLDGVVRSIAMLDEQVERERGEHPDARPEAPGAYVGLGARVWGWLALAGFGVVDAGEAAARATAIAAPVQEAVAADEFHDLLIGIAGAVVPLARLAAATGEDRWLDEAVRIGDRLAALAIVDGDGARWPGTRSESGLGGFAHGSVGIGWALLRLAEATGEDRFARLGAAGLAFQDSLWSDRLGGWDDLRKPGTVAANWCHGADGVGVVAATLPDGAGDPALRRAAHSTWADGLGVTHTLCHGDLGSWEVLDLALRRGVAPDGLTRDLLDARMLGGIEHFGPRAAVIGRSFRPGLMTGMGGMAYQLLRMHPRCRLPTLLLPDPALATTARTAAATATAR